MISFAPPKPLLSGAAALASLLLAAGDAHAVTCTIRPSAVSVGQTGGDVNNLFVYDESGLPY